MYRTYIIVMENVTATNSADLAWCFANPGTTLSLEFIRAYMSQRANATSAQCSAALGFKVTAFPTLTSTTPRTHHLSDPASAISGGTAGAAGTSGTNASAAGGGAATYRQNDNFNALNGFLWLPNPKETYIANASAASGFGLFASAAPATLTNWCAGLEFSELG